VTRLRVWWPGARFPTGEGIFFPLRHHCVQTGSENPPSLLSNGRREHSPRG